MPYRDAERKRHWEREHRERRNTARRIQRQTARSGHIPVSSAQVDRTADLVARLKKLRRDPGAGQQEPDHVGAIVARLKNRVLDPTPKEKPTSGWKVLLGVAVGIGVVLLAGLASIGVPAFGDFGPSPGSGSSGV